MKLDPHTAQARNAKRRRTLAFRKLEAEYIKHGLWIRIYSRGWWMQYIDEWKPGTAKRAKAKPKKTRSCKSVGVFYLRLYSLYPLVHTHKRYSNIASLASAFSIDGLPVTAWIIEQRKANTTLYIQAFTHLDDATPVWMHLLSSAKPSHQLRLTAICLEDSVQRPGISLFEGQSMPVSITDIFLIKAE